MNRLLRAGFAAGFVLVFQAAPAKADTIHDNGAAFYDNGLCAQYTVDPSCPGAWTVFDDFFVSSPSTLTDIFWTAALYGDPDFSDQMDPYPGSSELIDIRAWIYDADPVLGGGNLLHTIAPQGGNPLGNDDLNDLYGFDLFFDLQLTGLSINLAPGTYWLGMQHGTMSGIASVACVVGGCGNEFGNSTQWKNAGEENNFIGNEHAFRLEGNIASVPDSGSLVPLVGLVWAAMFVWRRHA